MDEKQKTTKREKITATYIQDTKRMHRFDVDTNSSGIRGALYFPRDGERIPDEVIVVLRTRARGQDDSPGS